MNYHAPVMGTQVLNYLNVGSARLVLDGTLGDGGHTELILENSPETCRVIGVDQDSQALQRAKKRLARFGDRVSFVHGNFSQMKSLLQKEKIDAVDGVLLDLGVSSMQIDTPERGFSFQYDGPLDMRMDRDGKETAADLLVNLDDRELETVIKEYGEERHYKKIVRAIRKAQAKSPVVTTLQLSSILYSASISPRHAKIHPATRTFQALRIAINRELERLKIALRASLDVLNAAGRLVVISFHSLEDRIVKQFFKGEETSCVCPPKMPVCVCGKMPTLKIVTGKPARAGKRELEQNPRASSAKLRAAERILCRESSAPL